MPKLRQKATGVVVSVADNHSAATSTEWELVDEIDGDDIDGQNPDDAGDNTEGGEGENDAPGDADGTEGDDDSNTEGNTPGDADDATEGAPAAPAPTPPRRRARK